jgi:hypothetical protein
LSIRHIVATTNPTAEIDAELDRLAALRPNWDAQGALPIAPEIIDAARRFAAALSDDLMTPPSVIPMAKGNLQFEWNDGPRSLELEFEQPTMIHFLKWHPEEGIEEEGLISAADVARAAALICWFRRSRGNV